MKKYYLGELHSRTGEKDKIYYNWKKDEYLFVAVKENGEERILSEKQKRYLYKKFHFKCDWIKLKVLVKSRFIILLILITISCSTIYIIKYRNLLEDLPKLEKEYCFDENILKEERDIEFLIKMCKKYIDKNDSYTEQQKEYLKLKWSKYLVDEGELFERKAILEMLQNLSSVPVMYDPSKEDAIASHLDNPHGIVLSPYAKNADLQHETDHCAIGKRLSRAFLGLEEGYCGAIGGKYCNNLTYNAENEYLLLISEIIGKENLKWCIINGEEEELVEEISQKTYTSNQEIKELILKIKNDREEHQLNKEIKKELAELAIKADEKNKENFIVLNAYYDKFDLDTSFLEDNYFFIAKEQTDWFKKYAHISYAHISDENKYNYTDLFEEEYSLKKGKTNE